MKGRKTGFVLVSVLFICMTLLSGVTGLAWYARNQMMRVQCERDLFRARTLASALVSQISRGLILDNNGYDHMEEEWFGLHVVPVGNEETVTVELRPLDNLVPVSSLFLPDGATLRTEMEYAWEQSVLLLSLENSANMILDYMDADALPRLGGSDSAELLNREVWSVSELRGFPGFSSPIPQNTEALRPEDIFTVWSEGHINLNVAPKQVLMILDPGMGRVEVERLLALRAERPFSSHADLADRAPFLKESFPRFMNLVGFRSGFFEACFAVPGAGESVFRFRVILHKSGGECAVVRWEES